MSAKEVMKDTISRTISFDVEFYKENHADLKGLSNKSLSLHYCTHGYIEGRLAAKYCTREELIRSLEGQKILELGPFCSPLLTGTKVKYFDVLNKSQLKKRARELGLSLDRIPEIDYVDPNGNISIIDDKFSNVISSHNLEHHPDLISHLIEVSKLLVDKGQYNLIVPNSKFCFDVNLPVSKISEIFNAFYEKRKVHSIGSVIEHRSLIGHNDTKKHWENNAIIFS